MRRAPLNKSAYANDSRTPASTYACNHYQDNVHLSILAKPRRRTPVTSVIALPSEVVGSSGRHRPEIEKRRPEVTTTERHDATTSTSINWRTIMRVLPLRSPTSAVWQAAGASASGSGWGALGPISAWPCYNETLAGVRLIRSRWVECRRRPAGSDGPGRGCSVNHGRPAWLPIQSSQHSHANAAAIVLPLLKQLGDAGATRGGRRPTLFPPPRCPSGLVDYRTAISAA